MLPVCRNGVCRDQHRHTPATQQRRRAGLYDRQLPGELRTIGSLTTDNWDPTGGVGAVNSFRANYAVAADGSAQYKTVQAAIDAAVADGGVARKYISVKAGTYNELVCVPESAPPSRCIASMPRQQHGDRLQQRQPDARFRREDEPLHGHQQQRDGRHGAQRHRHGAGIELQRPQPDVQEQLRGRHLRRQQPVRGGACRARRQGDPRKRLGHRQPGHAVSRRDEQHHGDPRLLQEQLHPGDTDFIFGAGTAVFHGCTIQYTAARLGARATSYVFAPSTAPDNPHGFLAINSTFNATGNASNNSTHLGRAWDQGVSGTSAYINGSSPNGQVVIRDSSLGAHIRLADPWGPSTAGRPYCSSKCAYSANRFFEYNNTGAGSGN